MKKIYAGWNMCSINKIACCKLTILSFDLYYFIVIYIGNTAILHYYTSMALKGLCNTMYIKYRVEFCLSLYFHCSGIRYRKRGLLCVVHTESHCNAGFHDIIQLLFLLIILC